MGWRHLCGHDRTGAFFHRAFSKGRQSHAYLITGPEGVGKKKVALEVVKFANCGARDAQGACSKCASCLSIEKRNHPDFIEIYPDGGTLKIDQVRELIHRLSFQRMIGRFRSGILCQAERLTEEAANCLLKSLEEPPEQSLLILTAENPRMIPQTVYSRCQHVSLSLLPPADIERLLRERGADETTARFIAFSSMGRSEQATREWEALLHIQEYAREVLCTIHTMTKDACEKEKEILGEIQAVIENKLFSSDLFGPAYSAALREIENVKDKIIIEGEKREDRMKKLLTQLGELENILVQEMPLRVKAIEFWQTLVGNKSVLHLGRFFRNSTGKSVYRQEESKQGFLPVLEILELYLRDVLFLQYVGEKEEEYLWLGGYRDFMKRDAERYPSQVLKHMIYLIDTFLHGIRLNIQLDLQALSFVLRMREELQNASGCRNKI